jgi:hypothetical protein
MRIINTEGFTAKPPDGICRRGEQSERESGGDDHPPLEAGRLSRCQSGHPSLLRRGKLGEGEFCRDIKNGTCTFTETIL